MAIFLLPTKKQPRLVISQSYQIHTVQRVLQSVDSFRLGTFTTVFGLSTKTLG